MKWIISLSIFFFQTGHNQMPCPILEAVLKLLCIKPMINTSPLLLMTALTPQTTPKILSILQQEKILATFFVLGEHVKAYPHLVTTIKEMGHEIGNHSYSHPVLTKKTNQQVIYELDKTCHVLNNLGIHPTWFRPPYGSENASVRKISSHMGMRMMLWNVDTQDWHTHKTEVIMANMKRDLKPGSVILMHDTKESTVTAIKDVITYLKDQGYIFMTLSQWQSHTHALTVCL